MFLSRLSETQNEKGIPLPMHILTDADPHGISIAYCYIRDLPNCHIEWIGVRPSDNGSLFRVSPSAMLPITVKESALLDGMLDRFSKAPAEQKHAFAPLVAELNVLKANGTKFEIEALASGDLGSDIPGVLRYLLDRT